MASKTITISLNEVLYTFIKNRATSKMKTIPWEVVDILKEYYLKQNIPQIQRPQPIKKYKHWYIYSVDNRIIILSAYPNADKDWDIIIWSYEDNNHPAYIKDTNEYIPNHSQTSQSTPLPPTPQTPVITSYPPQPTHTTKLPQAQSFDQDNYDYLIQEDVFEYYKNVWYTERDIYNMCILKDIYTQEEFRYAMEIQDKVWIYSAIQKVPKHKYIEGERIDYNEIQRIDGTILECCENPNDTDTYLYVTEKWKEQLYPKSNVPTKKVKITMVDWIGYTPEQVKEMKEKEAAANERLRKITEEMSK